MAQAPPRACRCGALVSAGQKCPGCTKDRNRLVDERRGTAYQRGYTKQWSRAAKAFLVEHPLCADPFGDHCPRFVGAECVDHVVPHKGDMELFWDRSNWQPLCIACNSKKAAVSEGGFGNGR